MPADILKLILPDGSSVDVSVVNPLPVTTEISLAKGVATGGSTTTLEDANRVWQVDIWENSILEVEILGVKLVVDIDSNAASALDFASNPLPAPVSAGDVYSIKTRPPGIGAKTVTTILTAAAIAAATTSVLADCAAINLGNGASTLALTVKARYNAAAVLGIRIHVRTSPTNDATGIHTAAASATIMTDADAHFVANELVGLTIENVTDGSSGVVTANTETTVTVAALAGGTLNQWSTNDVFSIDGGDYDTEDWDVWNPAFAADAVLRQTKHYDVSPMYAKVLVENLDAAQAVTDVEIISTRGA